MQKRCGVTLSASLDDEFRVLGQIQAAVGQNLPLESYVALLEEIKEAAAAAKGIPAPHHSDSKARAELLGWLFAERMGDIADIIVRYTKRA
jgi:hypothetical protein